MESRNPQLELQMRSIGSSAVSGFVPPQYLTELSLSTRGRAVRWQTCAPTCHCPKSGSLSRYRALRRPVPSLCSLLQAARSATYLIGGPETVLALGLEAVGDV